MDKKATSKFWNACNTGDLSLATEMLTEGKKIKFADFQSFPLAEIKAIFDNLKQLLQRGSFATNSKPWLFFVLIFRKWDLLAILLNSNYELQKQHNEHLIILHAAVVSGISFSNFKVLVEKYHLDVNQVDFYHRSVAEYVQNNSEIEQYLKSVGVSKILGAAGETAIHRYATEGNLAKVKDFIQSIPNQFDLVRHLDIQDMKEGRSALHYAAIGGHLKIVKYLIECKSNVSSVDHDGKPALHYATINKDFEIAKILVDSGATVDSIDTTRESSLIWAIKEGNIEMVKFLVQSTANINKTLYIALENHQFEIADYLLSVGENIHHRNNKGQTYLHQFTSQRNEKACEYLVKKGVDIYAKNNLGQTVFQDFVTSFSRDSWLDYFFGEWLLEHFNINLKDDSGKMQIEYCNSDIDIVKLILQPHYWNEKGNCLLEDIDSKFKDSKTCLQVAWKQKDFDAVGVALDFGANIDGFDVNELLMMVCKSKSVICFDRLISVGANIHQVDKDGNTPLLFACKFGNLGVAIKLIDLGANVLHLNKNRENCFHLILPESNCTVELAAMLIEKGIDVNSRDKFGRTPLMKFFRNPVGSSKLAALLLEKGANPRMEDNEGNNALHHVSFNGSEEVVKYLLDFGMDPNLKNKFGQTILSYALTTSLAYQSKVIQLLVGKGAKLSNPHEPLSKYKLQSLVDSKINLKEIGCSGIDWRFAVEDEKITEVFIENGFDVNEVDEKGFTPLIYASAFGSTKVLEILIEKGANLAFQNSFGYSTLHFAANYGKLENLESLINKYKETIDFKNIAIVSLQPIVLEDSESLDIDSRFREILHSSDDWPHANLFTKKWGKDDGILTVLKFLIETKNISLETIDERGNTLLELACKAGNLEVVRYLVETHKEIKIKIKINSSKLIEFICKSGSKDILELLAVEKLVSLGNPAKPVLFASKFGNLGILRYLENQKEVNWNCVDEDGNNGLHLACEKGHLNVTESLCNKLNANSRNKFNQTPLMLASKFGHFHIVSKLLERQEIELTLRDNSYYSAFDFACWSGDLDCVKLLHSKRVWVDFPSNAFKCATESGNHHILSFLNSIGLMIHFQDLGECIRTAEKLKRTEIVKILRNLESSIPIRVDVTGLLAIPKNEIKFGEKIGKGGFGKVFKGNWKGQPVAIKQLILKEFSDQAMRDLKKEANILFKLRGSHVVGLLGVINQEPLCLVMEFLENGSLYDYLQSKEKIEWNQRNEFVFEIAQGLDHLHSENVIHRDLKSPNILIDKNYNLKLADFGLASLKEETTFKSKTLTHAVGSYNWLAPELFESGAKNTKESDIYAFGMVCFEISTRRIPWQDIYQHQIGMIVSQGKRETELIPKEIPELIRNLIELCWNQNPMKRPIISDVLKLFKVEKVETTNIESTKSEENPNRIQSQLTESNNINETSSEQTSDSSWKDEQNPTSERVSERNVNNRNDISSWQDPGNLLSKS